MTHDTHNQEQPDLPDALRWELRALRKDVAPQPTCGRRSPRASPRRRSRAPRRSASPGVRSRRSAAAATLALAARHRLAVGPGHVADRRAVPPTTATTRIIAREAEAMTREYQAALKEIDAYTPPPAKGAPELKVLDRSAAQIRTALARDPDARFLLDRLQRTYTRRLEITQRLARTSLAS